MTKQQPPFNATFLTELSGGDQELEKQILSLFKETAEKCLSHLRTHCRQEGFDPKAWKEAVHELKGAAANLHASELKHACQKAEAPEDNTPEMLSTMVDEMNTEYRRLETYLKERWQI